MKMSAMSTYMSSPSRVFWVICCGVLLAMLPATVSAAGASAMAAASATKHKEHQHRSLRHHKSHRHRHGHRHHRHRKGEKRSDMKEDLSVASALDRMPTKVAEMFAQFQSTKDAAKAVDVLGQLNMVYDRALTQKDTMTPDCEDKRAELAKEVSGARSGLKDVEGHLTRLQGHMQTIQSGIDRNLAEVQSLREQYGSHRATCKKNKAESEKMLALLQKDMPIAKTLVTEATKGCSLPTAVVPSLTECSLPNGDFVTTFKLATFRSMISNCSGITEKIAALNLDRAVRGRGGASSAASLMQLTSSSLRGSSSKAQPHQHHRHHKKKKFVTTPAEKGIGLLQRYLVHRTVPKSWCTDVAPAPSCEAFSDSMATFVGNVEDLVRDLLGKSQSQEEHCRVSLESYDEQVKTLRRQADDGSVELANAAAEHSELATLRREKRSQVQDVNQEADREVATCGQQLSDSEATLCSARKLKKEMGTAAGQGLFLGDCEVGDWIRGPCSKSCGTDGTQDMTRDIISSPGPNPKCPSVKFARPCNRRACPVDGQMSGWEPWTGCSRACGGGTRARHRRVIREAQHGGLPVAETMQEQLCNTQACDQDCLLAEWTAWTNCTKVCNRGHKSRTRKVLRQPLGEGSCGAEQSAERFQTLPCSRTTCTKLPLAPKAKCTQEVDMTFVLDVSGSVTAVGTEKIKFFVKSVVDRMQIGTVADVAGATMGIVYYGSKASVASPLDAKSEDILTSLAKVTWQKDSTNTAQALGVARTLFEERGRATAKQVVIVVTDGMPESAFLTGVEVGRLKDSGARLSFVGVGKSVSRNVLRRWASWPWEENVVSADAFTNLDETKVTEVLANICGANLK